jgi:transcription antitermination factor NusG
MTPRWFVARTHVRKEKIARDSLVEHGFTAYMPVETRLTRHAHKRSRVERPLFVSYIFLTLEIDDDGAIVDMHKLRDVEGIAALIGISGRAYPIADAFISTVKEAEDAGAFDFTPRGVPNYKAGQKVKIIKGPFKGLTAEIAAATRDGRASIIMQAVYGRGTVKPVKINVENLELASGV